MPAVPEVYHPLFQGSGGGHVVGAYLVTEGPKGLPYWLEGDDRWTIDGELRIHGTGSEDYFNCGWYALEGRLNGPETLPSHGFPVYGTTFNTMRAAAFRWITATRFLRHPGFVIEHRSQPSYRGIPERPTGLPNPEPNCCTDESNGLNVLWRGFHKGCQHKDRKGVPIPCVPACFLSCLLNAVSWQHPGGLVTLQTLEEVRHKLATQAWAPPAWENRKAEIEKWASLPSETLRGIFPKQRGNVYHNFSCPDCRIRLDFDPFNPFTFICDACGKKFPPETDAGIYGADDNYHGTMYDGWICLFFRMRPGRLRTWH